MNHAEKAIELVEGARQADYGHPLDDFTKTAKIWSAVLGIEVEPEQVALCMVGVKLSREVNVPKADNIIDAHGYLLTYQMVLEEQGRRSAPVSVPMKQARWWCDVLGYYPSDGVVSCGHIPHSDLCGFRDE